MKVTIDIPDELIARLDAAQSAADNAGASYKEDLTADVRQALADAYSAQAEIFAELGTLVRVNALRTACVHATLDMEQSAGDWGRRAESQRQRERRAAQQVEEGERRG